MAELKQIWYATAHLQVTGNIVLNNPGPFREEGFEVYPICPGSGIPIARTMMAGLAEYCNVLALPIQRAVEGWPLKFLCSYQNSGWELWAAPHVRSLKDLEGRILGQSSGMARRYLHAAMKKAGADPSKLKDGPSLPLDFTGIAQILQGKVDAGILMSPVTSMARVAGLNMVLDLAEIGDPVAYGLMATDKIIRENRDQVVRMVRATMKSTRQLQGNAALARELILAQGVPEQYVEGAIASSLPKLNAVGDLSEASQREWIEYGKLNAGMDKGTNVPLAQVFDFSILKEAMAKL